MNEEITEDLQRQIYRLEDRVESLETQDTFAPRLPVNYGATSTIVGFSSIAARAITYLNPLGNLFLVNYYIDGTSNATNFTFTLPVALISGISAQHLLRVQDNGTTQLYPGLGIMSGLSNVVTLYVNAQGSGWTPSGNKFALGQFFFFAD